MTTRSPSVSSFLPSSSPNESRSFSPYAPWDPVRIPDAYSHYSKFKYRLWFICRTWYTIGSDSLPWFSLVSGENANGDLWLWEDEDEEGIREFAIGNEPLYICEEDWDDAVLALEMRFSRITVAANPVAHLPSQARLRFMAWLLVVVAFRECRISESPISTTILIRDWAEATGLPLTGGTCNMCGVSGVLPVWIETMLEIYPRDDLRSLPWHYKCNCLHSQLTATANTYSGQRGVPEIPLDRNSPVLHLLYELIVHSWPLFYWVVFRAGANDPAKCLTAFMDMIHGPDQDLFTWDDEDDRVFLEVLTTDQHRLTWYPQDWIKFIEEIPLKNWLQINNMTRIDNRLERDSTDVDTYSRVATVMLKYLPAPVAREKILTTLGIELEDYGIAFDTMARAVDRDHQNWSALANNLATNTYPLMRGSPSYGFRGYEVLEQVERQRPGPSFADYLGVLQNYRDDVQILVREVKKSIEKNSSTNHTISKNVHEHMKHDLSVIVARMVLFLRNQESYKEILSSRGTDAQQFLDLLQDLLDLEGFSVAKPSIFEALLRLSRASGLHPRCLPLLGLKKVGQQLAGGGFGDIWKGLVRRQSVCIKIMRIFDNSTVEAVLKEFGREALICRQLCHPNVLPFFGVYYFDNRLCLVSPWMEDGHIMKFLAAKKPTTTKHLSLILDIALGLQYLHEQKIVHGDLKGANILVTPSHRACITDFGVSSIVKAITVRFTHTTAKKGGGTANYLAPELLRGESENHFGSDVYAFSCVCHEIMTGNVPFYDLPNEMAVMFKVIAGERPPRPMSCLAPAPDGLWALMQKCWEQDVQMRPTAAEIVQQLAGPSIVAQRTPFTMDWSEEFTSKFRRTLQTEPLLPSVTQIERMLFGEEAAKACRECFPDQKLKNKQVARRPKRRYEDPKGAVVEQSAAKKSKP